MFYLTVKIVFFNPFRALSTCTHLQSSSLLVERLLLVLTSQNITKMFSARNSLNKQKQS